MLAAMIVAQIRSQRAKAQQDQMKREALNKTADTLHKGSTKPEDGSPAQKVLDAQGAQP